MGQTPRLVVDLDPRVYPSEPRGFAEAGGVVYFSARAGAIGRELWVIEPAPGPALLRNSDVATVAGFSRQRAQLLPLREPRDRYVAPFRPGGEDPQGGDRRAVEPTAGVLCARRSTAVIKLGTTRDRRLRVEF